VERRNKLIARQKNLNAERRRKKKMAFSLAHEPWTIDEEAALRVIPADQVCVCARGDLGG
jgi:hypothetical protein